MIKISGTLQALGDLQPDDIPAETVPRALIVTPDGRVVIVSGLTREECRALAGNFGDAVELSVGAAAS